MTEATTLDMGNIKKYVLDIHKLIMRKNLDWLSIHGGREGQGGKSTFSIIRALWVNPDFDPETQVIYDLESFNNYLDVHENKPGRVAFFDEAVLMLLGSEANTWESRRFQKTFVTHRDLVQEYYLCAPSPWRLMPYIREDRVNDFVLGYMEPTTDDFDRFIGYYNREDYVNFIIKRDARNAILVPSNFIKTYKPTTKEPFTIPKSKRVDEIYTKIFALKKEAQRHLRQETREGIAERRNGDIEKIKRPTKKDMLVPVVDRLKGNQHWSGTTNEACNVVGIARSTYDSVKNGTR